MPNAFLLRFADLGLLVLLISGVYDLYKHSVFWWILILMLCSMMFTSLMFLRFLTCCTNMRVLAFWSIGAVVIRVRIFILSMMLLRSVHSAVLNFAISGMCCVLFEIGPEGFYDVHGRRSVSAE